MSKRKIHQNKLIKLLSKPHLIGQEATTLRAVNVHLGKANRLEAEIDWLGFDGRYITIVEYKSGKTNRDKAIEQLRIRKDFIEELIPSFIAPIRTLYVHGDFKVEEIYL